MHATDRNHLLLSGMVEAAPLYSHTLQGVAFYRVPLRVERLSGTSDHLPVTMPERLIQGEIRPGLWLSVEGQLRSYDRYDETGRHLLITAYARHAEPCLAAEVRRDARGLLPAYAAYLREQLRMVFCLLYTSPSPRDRG